MKDENKYNDQLSMSELDERICKAINRLDWYFGQFNYIICGSIGLYIQGIDLKREFSDFDILVPGEKRNKLLRLWRLIWVQSGFKLDFPEIIESEQKQMPEREIIEMDFYNLKIKIQEKNDILRYKKIVADKQLWSDLSNQKHKQDIEKIKQEYNI